MQPSRDVFNRSVMEFQRARRQGILRKMVSRIAGKTSRLLVYEDVRKKIGTIERANRVLKDIPIDAIIGSVGKYEDFTRDFLPLRGSDRDRWANVKIAIDQPQGVPPIEVYQLGEAYFVIDGNHRVSIARQNRATVIEAYVKQVESRVPFPPDATEEDIIILAEFSNFLEQTALDRTRPESNIQLTEAGHYDFLLQQIEVQQFLLEFNSGENKTLPEAAEIWHDEIYYPMVEIIQRRGLLENYPNRTEADLFIWLLEHWLETSDQVGWHVQPDTLASQLQEQLAARPLMARLQTLVFDQRALQRFTASPTGQWRREHLEKAQGRMFAEILVGVSGPEEQWHPLKFALKIAHFEAGKLFGMYYSYDGEPALTDQEFKSQFESMCNESGITQQWVDGGGTPADVIIERSRWADLTIIPLPGNGTGEEHSETVLRPLLRQCFSPLLFVPAGYMHLKKVLLAYDGSPHADEAMFLAGYISQFWGLDLHVLYVSEREEPDPSPFDQAKTYLENYLIEAAYAQLTGLPEDKIVSFAEEKGIDLIVIGNRRSSTVLNTRHTSVVENVIGMTSKPVLVCH